MKPDDAEEYTQALGQVVAGGWRQIALGKKLGVPKALGLSVQDWVQQRLGGYVKLSITERKEAALELQAEGFSQRESAEVLGVDRETIAEDLGKPKKPSKRSGGKSATTEADSQEKQPQLAESPPPPSPAQAAIDAGETRDREARKEVHEKRSHKEEAQKKELQKEIHLCEAVHFGDFRDLASQHIPDDSVQLVLTDPPYDKEAISLVGAISKEAFRVLRPGGSLLFYSGQKYLVDVIAAASIYLRLWWIFCLTHRDQHQLLQKLGVRCAWKPILWFVKGTRGDVQHIVTDVLDGGGREKSSHEWQQAESEAAHLIEMFTTKNGVVVDFCAGSGTVLSAAKKLGRRAIGFEIDETNKPALAKRLDSIG